MTSLKDLLASCSKEVCVTFSINEAWLVLSIFEAEHPMGNSLRKVMLAIEQTPLSEVNRPRSVFEIQQATVVHEATALAARAYAVNTTPSNAAAWSAARAARAAYYTAAFTVVGAASAAWAAYWARSADPTLL